MRVSALFSVTLREAPAEVQSTGQQLLMRAGFIRSLGPGLFAHLPLAHRTMDKIERIVRQEMDAIGNQEIRLPTVQPAELWQATGHARPARGTLRFKDGRERDLLLAAPPHAAMVALARSEVRSYRQLPRSVYGIQSEFRDELHPRAGLIGAREFITLRAFSLDADEAGMQERYRAHQDAFQRIFRRCGLPVVTAAGQSAMRLAMATVAVVPDMVASPRTAPVTRPGSGLVRASHRMGMSRVARRNSASTWSSW